MSRRRRVIAPIVVTVVGLGALTGLQDTYFRAGMVEDSLTAASQVALADAGLDDVEVSFAGRDATLVASSERDAERAAEVVEAVRGVRVATATGGEVVVRPAVGPSPSASTTKSAAPSPSPSATPTPTPTPSPSPTAATEEQVQEQLVAIPTITFVTNSADLTPEGRATVQQAAAVLLANPQVKVTIEGHTDSVGTEEANLVLSQARAQAVLSTLVELGVTADRLAAQGFGETRPTVPDTTPENQATNRRVDFIVQQ
ncbi:OmpA family protein [Antribacter sp. KLBMP9083]|uniref:OmpA family protein n=1 Tax=Antribacter soli TaxID=2910976 RepID=A0AA41QDP9_9MICO|nr:OmpA family protein [Antribacter soli]MCF4121548.1 OmpA family protein [Antribacter soli]